MSILVGCKASPGSCANRNSVGHGVYKVTNVSAAVSVISVTADQLVWWYIERAEVAFPICSEHALLK